ncbi:MAG: tRNA1(Val) (adenine(37)-N6)-methyltransferase [Lachnospiraceae bacterium]|nr:tRNA1(Val) (adenine(37)-N6)-methyltransferase [Lachnospiraceae bacterium]
MIDELLLKPGERYDDLERSNLHIIQDPKRFCFGMDAVLLSGFIKAPGGARVLDMCTGTGIIPLLLSAKTEASEIIGTEIQPESADMASRSVKANALEEKIKIINADIKDSVRMFGKGSFDVVSVNPPYMPAGRGLANPGDEKAIARHEILCTLADVCSQAAAVLKDGGHFFMVHRPGRIADIFEELRKNRLEAKRMKFVQPEAGKKPNMVLIDAVKGGGRELIVEEPIIVFKEPGVYSDEIREIYGY